jgi:hypothetical protein
MVAALALSLRVPSERRLVRARLLAVITLLAALLPATTAYAAPAVYRSATLALESGRSLTLTSSKGSVSLLHHTHGPTALGVSEDRYRYQVGPRKKPIATVWVTIRTLPSGSKVVFTRLSAPRGKVPVTVALRTHAKNYEVRAFNLKASPIYDDHYGVDRTSGPFGWISLTNGGLTDRNVFFSKAYRFRPLKKTYASGATSYVKQFISEQPLISVARLKDRSIRVAAGLSASKDSCERYFIVTRRPIVTAEASAGLVASVTATESGWLDPTGTIRKAPYSIEPWTSDGYVHSLLEMRLDGLRNAYQSTGAPLFEDLILNTLYSLSLTRSADGLWRTDYTSTWVKAESGIVAPYIDTRHNEGIARASVRIADALDSRGVHNAAGIRTWGSPYAAFLASRAATAAVIRTDNGFYFADYYDANGQAKCHTSLNHALGEMNYLLKQCADTSATPLFDLAMKIRLAVDDSGPAWIAPNGDLYYQRNLNGTFSGTDYRTVTYLDLLESQMLLEQVAGARDPVFDELIASKQTYLGLGKSPSPASAASTPETRGPDHSLEAATQQEIRLP